MCPVSGIDLPLYVCLSLKMWGIVNREWLLHAVYVCVLCTTYSHVCLHIRMLNGVVRHFTISDDGWCKLAID